MRGLQSSGDGSVIYLSGNFTSAHSTRLAAYNVAEGTVSYLTGLLDGNNMGDMTISPDGTLYMAFQGGSSSQRAQAYNGSSFAGLSAGGGGSVYSVSAPSNTVRYYSTATTVQYSTGNWNNTSWTDLASTPGGYARLSRNGPDGACAVASSPGIVYCLATFEDPWAEPGGSDKTLTVSASPQKLLAGAHLTITPSVGK